MIYPFLSFTVACFNEGLYIYDSLRSIYEFSNDIIVLDNGSEDNTNDEVKRFISDHDTINRKIKLFNNDIKQTIDIARNFLIENASNEFLVKWDGDFIATKHITKIFDYVLSHQNEYDVFFWSAPNLYLEKIYQSKQVPFIGTSGDHFIHRKDSISYKITDAFPDTIIAKTDCRYCYEFIRNIERNVCTSKDNYLFIHMYCAKSLEYIFYRNHWSTFEIYADHNNQKDISDNAFWDYICAKQNASKETILNNYKRYIMRNSNDLYMPFDFDDKLYNLYNLHNPN